MAKKFNLGEFTRERFGSDLIVLRCPRDLDAYQDAIDAFDRTGERATLYRDLLALGVAADAVRRIAAGERLPTVSPAPREKPLRADPPPFFRSPRDSAVRQLTPGHGGRGRSVCRAGSGPLRSGGQ